MREGGGGGGLLAEIHLGKKQDTHTHTITLFTPKNMTIHQPTNPVIHLHTHHKHQHTAGR